MAMETFRTSHRRDFGWPWALPVRLNTWRPPEQTFQRPRQGSARAASADCDCPCPEHAWATGEGSALAHYMCLAGKEARLHQRSQAAREEIRRCLTRTKDAEEARRTKFPPLPNGEDWLTIYASDYTQKDMVPRLSYAGVLTELVSTGVPQAPLGRSLFAAYDDPTRFRRSPHTVPVYDPRRPVLRPARTDIWEQWVTDFPAESEFTVSYGLSAERTTRKCQPFKYPLRPQLPVGLAV